MLRNELCEGLALCGVGLFLRERSEMFFTKFYLFITVMICFELFKLYNLSVLLLSDRYHKSTCSAKIVLSVVIFHLAKLYFYKNLMFPDVVYNYLELNSKLKRMSKKKTNYIVGEILKMLEKAQVNYEEEEDTQLRSIPFSSAKSISHEQDKQSIVLKKKENILERRVFKIHPNL
jgi:hypothetical protein